MGNFIDSNGVNHGFVRSPSGDITTFDAPGASKNPAQEGTIPTTPNLFGQIAGFLQDANGVFHGFLRTP